MKIAWFPGHMRKAIRLIKESLSLVDLVLFVLDARVPASSRNPELENLIQRSKLLFILNKSDLADKSSTKLWIEAFRRDNCEAFDISSITGSGLGDLRSRISTQRKKLCEKRKSAGRLDEQLRLMVIGMPNVGKSSVINRLAGRNVARAGKRPGVTKGIQWIALSDKMELIDVPGVFYPHVEDEEKAWHLAAVGTVKEELLPSEEVAIKILEFLSKAHPEFPYSPARATPPVAPAPGSMEEALSEVGKRLGFLDKQGRVDVRRTSSHVLKRFREGKYGKLTLEIPARSAASQSGAQTEKK